MLPLSATADFCVYICTDRCRRQRKNLHRRQNADRFLESRCFLFLRLNFSQLTAAIQSISTSSYSVTPREFFLLIITTTTCSPIYLAVIDIGSIHTPKHKAFSLLDLGGLSVVLGWDRLSLRACRYYSLCTSIYSSLTHLQLSCPCRPISTQGSIESLEQPAQVILSWTHGTARREAAKRKST